MTLPSDGTPAVTRAPALKSDPVTSTIRPSLVGAVTRYQTLPSVAGAPHCWLSCASSASLVAWSMATTASNGSIETTVAPAGASFGGGAANAGVTGARTHDRMAATSAVRSLDMRP